MVNMGYIAIAKTHTPEVFGQLNSLTYNVQDLTNVNISDWPELSVLVIEEDATKMNQVCELLVRLKSEKHFPIWIISSDNQVEKTIRMIYLQLGVNGVFDQKVEKDEWLLMVRNSIDGKNRQPVATKETNGLAENEEQLKLIPQNLSIYLENGLEVDLTRLEFQIMELLFRNPRRTVTYEEIYEKVWKEKGTDGKYRVCNLIFHLRKKIERNEKSPRYIKTVRSKGYMLNI